MCNMAEGLGPPFFFDCMDAHLRFGYWAILKGVGAGLRPAPSGALSLTRLNEFATRSFGERFLHYQGENLIYLALALATAVLLFEGYFWTMRIQGRSEVPPLGSGFGSGQKPATPC